MVTVLLEGDNLVAVLRDGRRVIHIDAMIFDGIFGGSGLHPQFGDTPVRDYRQPRIW
jgi:hypothetical protein